VDAWINEDVEQLDAPVLDMGDVRPGDGSRPIGRTRLPEKSRGAIVPHGVSDRGEDKLDGNMRCRLPTASEIASRPVATVSGS